MSGKETDRKTFKALENGTKTSQKQLTKSKTEAGGGALRGERRGPDEIEEQTYQEN